MCFVTVALVIFGIEFINYVIRPVLREERR